MKAPYRKGVANHPDSESNAGGWWCIVDGHGPLARAAYHARQAIVRIGVSAGQVPDGRAIAGRRMYQMGLNMRFFQNPGGVCTNVPYPL
jgi:hypothetical protein